MSHEDLGGPIYGGIAIDHTKSENAFYDPEKATQGSAYAGLAERWPNFDWDRWAPKRRSHHVGMAMTEDGHVFVGTEAEMRKAADERSEKGRRGVTIAEVFIYGLSIAAMMILAWIAWGPRA